MTLIEEELAKLKDLIDRMRYVSEGEYVLAYHTNTFREYVSVALEALKKIYEYYKAKFGERLEILEENIDMAENRLKFLSEVKYGDVVATRDHNIIIDCLKSIEISLIEIDKSLWTASIEELRRFYKEVLYVI
jgi:Na+/phosphate symporter